MSKFELVFDMLVAFVLFGLLGTVGTFFALLVWAQVGIETLLYATAIGGISAGLLGAAVPVLRKAAVFVLSLFAPSSW